MFYNIRFPENMSLEFKKTVNFSTEVNTTKNLTEQRIKLSNYCYNVYEINYRNLTNEELNKIVSFFNIVNGRYLSFRFKDWLDYKTTNQIIGTYFDSNKFQLVKSYFIDSNLDKNYTKVITKPVENTVKIYVNNIQITNFLIDYSTGILTIQSQLNENDIITADFEFDTHVRFFSDSLSIKNKTKNISDIEELKIMEIF